MKMNAAVENASLRSAGVDWVIVLKTCWSAVVLSDAKSGETNPLSVRKSQTRKRLVKMKAMSGRKTCGCFRMFQLSCKDSR